MQVLARSVYARAHASARGSRAIASAASVCRRVIVFRIRENSERDQAMAPATGGWFFGSGGLCCAWSNMFLVSTISRVNCSRMSWNLEDIVRPIAPELSTRSNEESRSNASSAERSFLNDWSTNALADFSTSSRSRSKSDTTTCQSANRFGSKMSNSTLRAARAMSVTRAMTSSIASGSPVTVLSLLPRNR